ncbi:hypothetical protein [Jiangella mangrovi]|uniref:Uncharacterized protein n=1 Tax=Jiangella mangrovi TaxID=1524084 RepID=A0A7W9GXT4_9ACTN|nr:hypothetical protein [Jiangella mangrovi]MBB5791616.1 hypothetical protein [Jiangella mangrovi]
MTDFIAELNLALDSLPMAERRTALRALMPSIVHWYQESLVLDDPSQPVDVSLLLWVEELSAGLIGPLCAAAQDVRLAATPVRQSRRIQGRVPGQRHLRAAVREP